MVLTLERNWPASDLLSVELTSQAMKYASGETIKKKYNTILDMLKKERLTFGNQLEGLEGTIKKQEQEIGKLKVPYIISQ